MIGVILNHRYRVAALIGTGGMAQVYRAVNLTTRKNVAIKMLKPEYRENPEFLRRFEREARAVLHLSHENIVRAYGVGQYDGMPYIVLEYVEGRTLKEIIQERGAMPAKSAVSLCTQVLEALSAAHEAGIVHRDVKPQNVIITPSGRAKLTDFGIARDVQATTVTFAGSTVLGSAHYLSPEQAKGKPVTAESDLYSVGVMLYEMLTGDVPFSSDSTVSIALKHINETPLSPIELNPRIPPALNEAVLIALRKEPLERFDSARRMAWAINRALRDPNWHPITGREQQPDADMAFSAGSGAMGQPDSSIARLHGAWKIAIVVGVFISILIGTFLATRSSFTGKSGSLAVVPSLTGKTLQEAQSKAADYGLALEIEGYVASTAVDYGRIVSQSPDAGFSVKSGSSVKVSVSAGPEVPVVPNLAGKTYDETVAAIQAAGLQLGTVSYQVSDVAIGYVCAQSPLAGTEIIPGSTVDIIISATAANMIPMPAITSLSLSDALAALDAVGFERIYLRYDEAGMAENTGEIISQQPNAGETVPSNMTVTLTVSGAAPSDCVSDIAYNLTIEKSGTPVMVTIEETVSGVHVERILFEGLLQKGEKVPVSFTATAQASGRYELILYVNGTEVRRQDTSFSVKG